MVQKYYFFREGKGSKGQGGCRAGDVPAANLPGRTFLRFYLSPGRGVKRPAGVVAQAFLMDLILPAGLQQLLQVRCIFATGLQQVLQVRRTFATGLQQVLQVRCTFATGLQQLLQVRHTFTTGLQQLLQVRRIFATGLQQLLQPCRKSEAGRKGNTFFAWRRYVRVLFRPCFGHKIVSLHY
ncbi:MAG: hypothetical protein LBN98_03975 [Prevotellaceae bacterium]|jgi:hypothetical protein|nr:hypothetical protein [Prevotellaceae bacterium]